MAEAGMQEKERNRGSMLLALDRVGLKLRSNPCSENAPIALRIRDCFLQPFHRALFST